MALNSIDFYEAKLSLFILETKTKNNVDINQL